MDVFNIFLIFLMACIGIGIVIGGLYMGGVCSVVTLFGESDDCPADPDTDGDDGPPSCSSFTDCPDGQVVNGTSTGTTAAECCMDPAPGTCGQEFTSGCPTNMANNVTLPCPDDGDCDATHCCQTVTTSSGGAGGGDGGGDDFTYNDATTGINYFSCEHAIRTSRADDDDYPGDCPWPLKSLSSQTGGDALENNNKRWIPVQTATAGMTSSDASAKATILEQCCPEREIPVCIGPKIGSGGGFGRAIDNCAYMPPALVEQAGTTRRVKTGVGRPGGTGAVYHKELGRSYPTTSSTRTVTTGTGQLLQRGLTTAEQGRIYQQCSRGTNKSGESTWGADDQSGRHFVDTWQGTGGSAWNKSYFGFCTTDFP